MNHFTRVPPSCFLVGEALLYREKSERMLDPMKLFFLSSQTFDTNVFPNVVDTRKVLIR